MDDGGHVRQPVRIVFAPIVDEGQPPVRIVPVSLIVDPEWFRPTVAVVHGIGFHAVPRARPAVEDRRQSDREGLHIPYQAEIVAVPVRVTQREIREKEIIGGTAGRVTVDSEPFAGIRPAIIGLRDTMIGSGPFHGSNVFVSSVPTKGIVRGPLIPLPPESMTAASTGGTGSMPSDASLLRFAIDTPRKKNHSRNGAVCVPAPHGNPCLHYPPPDDPAHCDETA